MANYKIKWSNLLYLTELDFIPDRPKQLTITDEIIQSISWLTGATRHDRKLLRCDDNGILLIGDPWSNLTEVETAALYPADGVPDVANLTAANKGVLIATSTQPVKITFQLTGNGLEEDVYLPPNWLYWYGHYTGTITATYVTAPTGATSFVGVTAFN